MPEFGVELCHDSGRQQPELGCPRGGISLNFDLTINMPKDPTVLGDFGADDCWPVGEHSLRRKAVFPALLLNQFADKSRNRLGIVALRSLGGEVLIRPVPVGTFSRWYATPVTVGNVTG